MRLSSFAIPLVLLVLMSPNAFAQEHGETPDEGLQRHHIALNKEAVIAALRNPDWEVRTFAAMKLADNRAKDAIPSLIEAMRAEPVPLTKVNIAVALVLLGDQRGLVALKAICNDPAATEHARMDAVRHVFDQHDDSCRDAVMHELQSGDDPDGLTYAIYLTRRFGDLSQEDSQRVFDLIVKALSNQAPGVRLAASNTLARLGNVAAIPYLQEALEKEEVEGRRVVIQRDLQRLQKQNHPQ